MKFWSPFLLCIFFIVAIKSYAQTSYKELDSISKIYKKQGNLAKAISLSHEMKVKAKNKNELAKVYYKLGLYHKLNKKNDSSYSNYIIARDLLVKYKNKDSILLGKIFQKLAITQSIYDDFSASDISAIEGIKYFNGRKPKKISSLYNCLGMNSDSQQAHQQAIKYYEQALKITTENKDELIIKNNMANSYRNLKRYDKAISIFESILSNRALEKNSSIESRVIHNLAHTKWKQNSEANVLPRFLKAKNIREKNKDYYGLMASYRDLSDYFYEVNPKKSEEFANKMLRVAKQENSKQTQIYAYDRLLRLNTISNRRQMARSRKLLSDSLQIAKQVAKNKYARIKFHSEQNEKDALVYQQLASENKYKAEKEKNQKNAIFYISSLLMLGFFGYTYYRKQQVDKEKVQEIYKTEQRLAKKIHDELANDVYRVLSKAQTEELSTNYINELNDIYIKTRNISHEHEHIETGEHFAEALNQLFEDFHTNQCKIIHKSSSEVLVNTFSKEQQIVVYRVLQELLVNMKKHSKATMVVIQFSLENKQYKIRFKDNGIGTNINKFKKGLQNTETRIKLINGTITFESAIDKGFEAIIKFKK